MESCSPDEPPNGYYFLFQILTLENFSVEVFLSLLAIVFFIIGSALISGSEVAFFSLLPKQIKDLQQSKDKKDIQILHLLERPQYLLATILIANNLFNIALVLTSYYVSETLFYFTDPTTEFLVTVVLITFILVLFGEIIPKVYASDYKLRLSRFTAPLLVQFSRIFYPLSSLLVQSTSIIAKRLVKKDKELDFTEIDHAMKLIQDEKTTEEDVQILKGIMRFGNVTVKQIMRARVNVVGVEADKNFGELKDFVIKEGYSRFPVYEDSLDNIIGIVYAKDLLEFSDKSDIFNWRSLLKPAIFVPETKKIDDLLEMFKSKRKHMTIVVDEYGGTSGIATLEDVLEEVVGDIPDEYDLVSDESKDEELFFRDLGGHNYIFEGAMPIIDVCKKMDIPTDTFEEIKGDSDSLAGLILEILGGFPKQNQVIRYENYAFRVVVIDVKRGRIDRVKITMEGEVAGAA